MPRESRREPPAPTQWDEAPELAKLAAPLIEKYHGHLRDQPLLFVWRSIAQQMRGGKGAKRSQTLIIGGLPLAISADPRWAGKSRIYVVAIPRAPWAQLTDDGKLAEMDIALTRLEKGKSGLTLVDISLSDIVKLIQRHGLYADEVRNLAAAVRDRQHELDFGAFQEGTEQEQEDRAVAGAPEAALPSEKRRRRNGKPEANGTPDAFSDFSEDEAPAVGKDAAQPIGDR